MVRENEIMEALIRSEERAKFDRTLQERMANTLDQMLALQRRTPAGDMNRTELIRWLIGAVVLASLGSRGVELALQLSHLLPRG